MIGAMGEGRPGKAADQTKKDAPRSSRDGGRRRLALRLGILALAAVVAVVALVLTRDGDSSQETAATQVDAPRIVSAEELEEIAGSLDYSIFWAGSIEGQELEVGGSGAGGVLIRYLDQGDEPGAQDEAALAIGSYPMEDPNSAVEGFAARPGAIVRKADDGRTVVSSVEAPSSVYFASPDGGVQVEVYDASPERAMDLARSGTVKPVR
jgi:hypothetical protein